MDFKEAIYQGIANSNNNHANNFDEARYGFPDPDKDIVTLKEIVKKRIFKDKISFAEQNDNISRILNLLLPIFPKLDQLYSSLENEASKDLMIQLLCYRMFGHKRVKLPLSDNYVAELDKVSAIADRNDSIDPNHKHFKLYKFNLNKINRNIEIYYTALGILTDFVFEQYKYKSGNVDIAATVGDVVIDAGGCWGDTALYFADQVGNKGKVYSFEFIPNNIKLYEQNVSLNPALKERINLVKNPVWNKSGVKVYFQDNGPGSKISFEEFSGHTGTTETMSIDDLCKDFEKVDFIKMDIEGAEPYALEGAKKTIMKFKPKLAISIYHSIEDFTEIPKWISDLGLGYKLYMGHYTIHLEETVIFAIAD